jgi:hypothetical protein
MKKDLFEEIRALFLAKTEINYKPILEEIKRYGQLGLRYSLLALHQDW